ncbi:MULTISPECIES: hypothetical protein [Actinomadura]|uniref:YCII-related domain-containing protein n=1 Tax=Actinomadura yumaensis TaxID=111807 RepID=A0ABW2CN77_9ACTN|nr:hypothetical protein [Actinomadura sp. J1-007]MWK37924.1 hypothetical protein [Actinomadura sp. J1-007]
MPSYTVLIEIRYAGGQRDEQDEARRVLAGAVPAALTPGPGGTVILSAVLDADGPLAALTALDEHLQRALMSTGLFEEFDVSGRILHVAPQHAAERVFAWTTDYPFSRTPKPPHPRGVIHRLRNGLRR